MEIETVDVKIPAALQHDLARLEPKLGELYVLKLPLLTAEDLRQIQRQVTVAWDEASHGALLLVLPCGLTLEKARSLPADEIAGIAWRVGNAHHHATRTRQEWMRFYQEDGGALLADNARLRIIVEGLTQRVAAQAEVLARKAERMDVALAPDAIVAAAQKLNVPPPNFAPSPFAAQKLAAPQRGPCGTLNHAADCDCKGTGGDR